MGYTIEKGKFVIWTVKTFVADRYPFHDEGENHTYFYKNLYDRDSFAECLSMQSEEYKIKFVADALGLSADKILLKSKKSHHKLKNKK